MEFTSQIIPALVVLFSNLMSGKQGGHRWEIVTALFGWCGAISLAAYFILFVFSTNPAIKSYVLQFGGFTLLTAVSRDYEKFLQPIFKKYVHKSSRDGGT